MISLRIDHFHMVITGESRQSHGHEKVNAPLGSRHFPSIHFASQVTHLVLMLK